MNEADSTLLDTLNNIIESKYTAIRLIGLPLLLSSGSKKERRKQRKCVQNAIDDALRKLDQLSLSPNNPCEHFHVDFYEPYREYMDKGRYSDASKLAHELVNYLLREEQKYWKAVY